MGAELVGLVSAKWSGVRSLSQYKILVRMALTALDQDGGPTKPAATYYAGWQPLALALGRELPEEDDYSEAATRRRKAIRDEVIRNTSALEKAGAIKATAGRAGQGNRQTWKLTL